MSKTNTAEATDVQKAELTKALIKVANKINSGNTDLEGLVIKVATESPLFSTSKNWTTQLVNGVNRVIALSTVGSADRVKRAGLYKTVSPDAVIDKVFGASRILDTLGQPASTNKVAALGSWNDILEFQAVKVASDAASAPKIAKPNESAVERATRIVATKQAAEDAGRRWMKSYQEDIMVAVKQAAAQFEANDVMFRRLEEAVSSIFDAETVKVASDHLADMVGATAESRFDAKTAAYHFEDMTKYLDVEPYKSMRELAATLKLAAVHVGSINDMADAFIKQAADELRPADVSTPMTSALFRRVKKLTDGDSDADAPRQQATMPIGMANALELFTPETFRQMQQVKAKAALASALRDETISKADVADITSAYNSLASLSPQLLLSGETLTPVLREALERNSSSFSAKQLIDMNKNLS